MQRTITKEPMPRQGISFAAYEQVVTKNYLECLDRAEIERNASGFGSALSGVCIDRVTKIVYDKDEDTLDKLKSVFSALYSAGTTAFVLLKNSNRTTEFYIGINSATPGSAIKIFERSMAGNFPGCSKIELAAEETGILSDLIRDEKHNAVGVVTGVPSLKNEDQSSFTQGLEKIIDAMGDREYVALLLGCPVSRSELERVAAGYANIYSALSMLDINSVTASQQSSKAFGKSVAESFSEALSTSIAQTTTVTDTHSTSKTNTHTVSSSTTRTHTESTSTTDTKSSNVNVSVNPLAVGGAIAGACLGGPIGAAVGGVLGGMVGGLMGTSAGYSRGRSKGVTNGSSDSTGETEGVSDAVGTTEGDSHALSVGETQTKGITQTKGVTDTASETDTLSEGLAYQYGFKNRGVEEALKTIDAQLDRIQEAKHSGAWNWAAYFVASDPTTVQIGTHIYSGILRGSNSGFERNAVACWHKKDAQFIDVVNSLARFQHPIFRLKNEIRVMPTTLVSTSELAVGMAFPQKSIPGIPVFDSVEFGRSVTTYDQRDGNQLTIGHVFHLGSKECTEVALDVNSLTSHMFVTGSTGSGKSNFIYSLLSNLRMDCGATGKGVRFLVIEPAKGEYKRVLGGVRGVKVFGTNPYETELLRINPFSFPAGIHVMEHIDRLVEILNAAWPMYAAMPAILKDALEQSYVALGWDIIRSTCAGDVRTFPDFHDLLSALPRVIDASAYDSEVKSNYAGALLTRVKALTNGYCRTIFQKDELAMEDLFDKSCIVDISRVGSSETKSLLMGIVFLKLQEYRMATATEVNSGLRHLTVIEEAHNLLRKTSSEQGMESANLAGKSVEMMSNAIAEMRTYGEGFLIADQAPGLLDPAVIRNTNTKVVFRLPDFDDRALVGKSENLTDEQINELSRLPTGCAAVFQNNWQEAVLCQIDKFSLEEKPYRHECPVIEFADARTVSDIALLRLIIAAETSEGAFLSAYAGLDDSERNALSLYYSSNELSQGRIASKEYVLDSLYNAFLKTYIDAHPACDSVQRWTSTLLSRIFAAEPVRELDEESKEILLSLVFKVIARYDGNDARQREFWVEQASHVDMWRAW